jgi:hypothetical protein
MTSEEKQALLAKMMGMMKEANINMDQERGEGGLSRGRLPSSIIVGQTSDSRGTYKGRDGSSIVYVGCQCLCRAVL